jgi:large subunit ribosomal protein L15
VNVDLGSFPANAAVRLDELKTLPRPRSRSSSVLGGGEIKHALAVKAHKFSGKAKEAIEKAGGSTEEIASK